MQDAMGLGRLTGQHRARGERVHQDQGGPVLPVLRDSHGWGTNLGSDDALS